MLNLFMTPSAALHPHEGRDVNWLLDYRARTRADHPFLVYEPFEGSPEIWTYARFHARVLRLAAGLWQRGIREGDAVLVHLDNGPEFELAWMACARVGAIVVTTNTRSAGEELRYYAEQSRAVAAIAGPEYRALFSENIFGLRWLAFTERRWDGAMIGVPAGELALNAIDGDPAVLPELRRDPWRYGSVQYTSGTTSRPKGVLWTHGNALWGAQSTAFHERLTSDSVHLVTMPQFHTNARNYSILPTLWVGGTVVLTPKFSASRFWKIAGQHRCTHASMLRFFYRILLEQDGQPEHQFLVWNAGAKDDRLQSRFNLQSLGHYGSTETVGPCTATDLLGEGRNGTIGHPAPGYGVRVVDDDNQPAARGMAGNLQVQGIRGAQMFCEYLYNPEATRDAFTPDDWFITGDRAVVGDDGALTFVDRVKDMLKIAGENVSAAEVERVLLDVPGIEEAAVVGRPDPRGDAPVAFVVTRSALSQSEQTELAQRIEATCRQKLAPFKVPQQIHFLPELPRATLEKVNKAELRRRLTEEV